MCPDSVSVSDSVVASEADGKPVRGREIPPGGGDDAPSRSPWRPPEDRRSVGVRATARALAAEDNARIREMMIDRAASFARECERILNAARYPGERIAGGVFLGIMNDIAALNPEVGVALGERRAAERSVLGQKGRLLLMATPCTGGAGSALLSAIAAVAYRFLCQDGATVDDAELRALVGIFIDGAFPGLREACDLKTEEVSDERG